MEQLIRRIEILYLARLQKLEQNIKNVDCTVPANPENFAMKKYVATESIQFLLYSGRWGDRLQFEAGQGLQLITNASQSLSRSSSLFLGIRRALNSEIIRDLFSAHFYSFECFKLRDISNFQSMNSVICDVITSNGHHDYVCTKQGTFLFNSIV